MHPVKIYLLTKLEKCRLQPPQGLNYAQLLSHDLNSLQKVAQKTTELLLSFRSK